MVEPPLRDRAARLAAAGRELGIDDAEMAKAVAYSGDRYRFALVVGWFETIVGLAFLAAGFLGVVEGWARGLSGGGAIATGLAFYAVLGLAASFFDLPFSLYSTFVIEERHGFNRETLRGFFLDRLKGLAARGRPRRRRSSPGFSG